MHSNDRVHLTTSRENFVTYHSEMFHKLAMGFELTLDQIAPLST